MLSLRVGKRATESRLQTGHGIGCTRHCRRCHVDITWETAWACLLSNVETGTELTGHRAGSIGVRDTHRQVIALAAVCSRWRRMPRPVRQQSADPACERFRIKVLKESSSKILRRFSEASRKNPRLRGRGREGRTGAVEGLPRGRRVGGGESFRVCKVNLAILVVATNHPQCMSCFSLPSRSHRRPRPPLFATHQPGPGLGSANVCSTIPAEPHPDLQALDVSSIAALLGTEAWSSFYHDLWFFWC